MEGRRCGASRLEGGCSKAGDEAPLLLVSGVLQRRGKMCGYIVGLQSLIDFTKIIGLRKLTMVHILKKTCSSSSLFPASKGFVMLELDVHMCCSVPIPVFDCLLESDRTLR